MAIKFFCDRCEKEMEEEEEYYTIEIREHYMEGTIILATLGGHRTCIRPQVLDALSVIPNYEGTIN